MLHVKLVLDQAIFRNVVHMILAPAELAACARTRRVGECSKSKTTCINTYEIFSSALKPNITFAKLL